MNYKNFFLILSLKKSETLLLLVVAGIFIFAMQANSEYKLINPDIEFQTISYPQKIPVSLKENNQEAIKEEAEIADPYLIRFSGDEFLEKNVSFQTGFSGLDISIETDKALFKKENFYQKQSFAQKLKKLVGAKTLPKFRLIKNISPKQNGFGESIYFAGLDFNISYEKEEKLKQKNVKQIISLKNKTAEPLVVSLVFKNKIKTDKIYWGGRRHFFSPLPEKVSPFLVVEFYGDDKTHTVAYDISDISSAKHPQMWIQRDGSDNLLILSVDLYLPPRSSSQFSSVYKLTALPLAADEDAGFVIERGTTWNNYYNPMTKKFVYKVTTSPVNYKDRNGKWHPINLSIRELESPYCFGVSCYKYGLEENYFKTYFNSKGEIISFTPDNYWMKTKIVDLDLYDPFMERFYSISKGAFSFSPRISKSRFGYPNIYRSSKGGSHRLNYDINSSSVIEEYIIETKSALPSLEEFSKEQVHNMYLGVVSVFEISDDLEIELVYRDGNKEIWNKDLGRRRDIESINFYSQDKNLQFRIEEAFATDESGERISVFYAIDYAGGRYILRKMVPLSWLLDPKRVYPIVIDPTATYYAGSADGYVAHAASTWSAVHDATTGTQANSTDWYYADGLSVGYNPISRTFNIARSFFPFDTSGLPDNSVVISASLYIYGYQYADSDVSAQEGTQGSTLGTDDYDAFTGSTYGTTTWSTWAYNTITFNSTGRSNINKTGTTYICAREYSHDYLNVSPGSFIYQNGLYYSEYTGTSRDPYLSITYDNPPQVGTITLNGGTAITLIENSTTSVVATATVSDADGYSDIVKYDGNLYRSGVGSSCSFNDNNCYQRKSCSLSSCAGTSCILTCEFDVWFHADPTDTGTWASEWWEVMLLVGDSYDVIDEGTTSQELNSLQALNVSPSSFDYGTMNPGENTGTLNQTTTITNTGNIAIDAYIYGTDLISVSDNIPVNYQEYSTSSGVSYGSGTDATSSSTNLVELDLSKPTSHPSTSTDDVYWGLGIPIPQPAGNYKGTITFSATND